MGYSYLQFKKASIVFHHARKLPMVQKCQRLGQAGSTRSARDYNFRQISPIKDTFVRYYSAQHGYTSSDEEYTPVNGRKRRAPPVLGAPPKKSKAKSKYVDSDVDDDLVPQGKHRRTPSTRVSTFITLCLPNRAGLQLLGKLNERSDSKRGCEDKDSHNVEHPEHNNYSTYLERQDAEAALIDNVDGRKLRNRKIPDRRINPSVHHACTECQKSKRRKCSLIRDGKGPCSSCERLKLDCHPVPEISGPIRASLEGETSPSPSRPRSGAVELPRSLDGDTRTSAATFAHQPMIHAPLCLPKEAISTETQLPDTQPDAAQPGNLVVLTTSFSHPLSFYVPRHSPNFTCPFCADFRFGVYGHGTITISALTFDGGLTYEEMGDGHRADGIEPTRMCVDCTLRRLCFIRCVRHTLQKNGEVKTEQRLWDYEDEICNSRMQPRLVKGAYPTCSVCAGPAFYQCVADQKFDHIRQPLGERGKGLGCGFQVCEGCYTLVNVDGRLDRGRVERGLRREGKVSRADVDFLWKGGVLEKAELAFLSKVKEAKADRDKLRAKQQGETLEG